MGARSDLGQPFRPRQTGTVITFLFYTDGSPGVNSVACASFVEVTVIFMKLPDLMTKFGKSLKPWNKLKIQLHPNNYNYIYMCVCVCVLFLFFRIFKCFYKITFVSADFTVHEAGTSLCRKELFCLTTHSTHFIYGYMVSDIWQRTI